MYGLDLFYDSSIRTRMSIKDFESNSKLDNLRQGIHIGINTRLGSTVFSFHVGSYLFLKWNDDEFIYSRLSLRYFHNRYIYNLSLKTHYGRKVQNNNR